MAKLDNFSGLTRPQEDLLKKHYCFGSLALLNINLSKDNLTFHTRLSERSAEHPRASAWLQYKTDCLLLKGKRRNDRFSYYKLELTPSKLVKNFKAVFECKLEDSKEADSTISFEYIHNKIKTKLSYLTAANVLRVQKTAGKPDIGFGLDTKVSLDSLAITNHTQAFWYFKNNARLVIKHVGKDLKSLGSFEYSYLHALTGSSNVGSKVTADWASRKCSLEVGGDYQYDPSTWVKGKVNSEGRVGLALTRQATSNIRYTVASELTSRSLIGNESDPFKLGFRLDFTD